MKYNSMEKIKWNKKNIQLNQEREEKEEKRSNKQKTSMTAVLIQSDQ